MTDKEAMKQALEALEQIDGAMPFPVGRNAIIALRQALEQQPADEPVAVVTGTYGGRFTVKPINPAMVLPLNMALYTRPQPPREWVGLTNEEAIDIGEQYQWYDRDCERFDSVQFARAIEAKLKEKNA